MKLLKRCNNFWISYYLSEKYPFGLVIVCVYLPGFLRFAIFCRTFTTNFALSHLAHRIRSRFPLFHGKEIILHSTIKNDDTDTRDHRVPFQFLFSTFLCPVYQRCSLYSQRRYCFTPSRRLITSQTRRDISRVRLLGHESSFKKKSIHGTS